MGFAAYTKHVGASESAWVETLETEADVGDKEERVKEVIRMKETIFFQRHAFELERRKRMRTLTLGDGVA